MTRLRRFWQRLLRRGVAAQPAPAVCEPSAASALPRLDLDARALELGIQPVDPSQAQAFLRAWLELTQRQQQVVCLTCMGHTNRQIARRLRISPNTVKGHLALAYRQFGVRTRAELRVALASWDFSGWKM
jgi:DNA-binding CsgD family transcriptional regulator